MTTTIKKKIISGVALLCTLMLLIGILPTSMFKNNTADAAGSGNYKLRIVYPVVVEGDNHYYSNMYIHAWDNTESATGKGIPVKMDRTDHVYEVNLLRPATSYKTATAADWYHGKSNECSLDWSKANDNVLTIFANSISGYTLQTTYLESSTQLYKINFDFSDVYSTLSTLDGISTFGMENNTNYGPYYVDRQQSSYIYHFDYFNKQYSTVALTIHRFSTWNITFSGLDWNKAIDNTLNIKVKSLSASGKGSKGEQLYTPTFEYGKNTSAGETLYIIGTNTIPTVKFYDDSNNKITSDSVETVIGDLTNYNDSGNKSYSVVIPEGATKVSFNDGTPKELSNYTSTNNAYDLSNNNWVSYTEPDIRNSTLYIDTTDSGYTAPITIKYNGTTATMTKVSDSNIYKYKFVSSSLLPTKNTPVKITDSNNKAVTLYYNPNITNKNKFILKDSTWGKYTKTYSGKIYFDATLSKLSYNDSGGLNSGSGMPYYADGSKIYVYATKADGSGGKAIIMTKEASHTEGTNTWNDVWVATIPDGYTRVRFTAWANPSNENAAANGDGTAMYDIPTDLANPCFYADTSDDIIYNGGNRSGYWDEVYTIRDAETGKTGKDVVKIDKSTFTKNNSTLYVNSTFYDYYTDYELNGNNRKNYGGTNVASHRNWVNFRQFDQALSDYYNTEDVGANNAIYTGHFQPTVDGWDYPYQEISNTLNLYGCASVSSADDKKYFFANNNSVLNSNGNKLVRTDGSNGGYYDYATQNIVSGTLKNGVPTSYGKTTKLPYFNEDFLLGNNSKNTKIGDVYNNVAFPFTKENVAGVDYWVFDSSKTTLAMKQDSSTNEYFLQDVGKQDWSKNLISNGTVGGGGEDNPSTQYGFFPLNNATVASGKNYNYGFGTKLEFKFRLTNNGKVTNSSGTEVPIKFEFSGDDDVWVFIDDHLVLDVGGDHGIVTGTINFAELKSTVSKVKKSANNRDIVEGSVTTEIDGNVLNNTSAAENNMSEEHTLTMFYMERGMWESNMRVQFNFPDENQLEVEKTVDKTDVNPLFTDLFDNTSIFDFSIKNLATHYGTKEVTTTTVSKQTFNDTFTSDKLQNVSGNTFVHEDSKDTQTNVVHWYANQEDTNKSNNGQGDGLYRNKRWGRISYTGNDTLDITDMQYLSFKYYYDCDDTPTLSNMYIRIEDASGNSLGSLEDSGDYLSGKTYGSPNMTSKSWQTIKIDLSKLTQTGSFDKTKVKYIYFGYNYPRDIYLDDFVFEPSASSTTLTGFVTKQYEIPDYGSANSAKLENATGATYTSSMSKAVGRVDEKGIFILQNNETVLFRDQFRRGSYISLNEELTPKQQELFKTSYTVYENDQAVTSFSTSGSSYVTGNTKNLKNVSGCSVDDGRKENKITTADSEGKIPSDNNNYNGSKPTENTFVFRSYSEPDNVNSSTKLKVVYTNKVNTNSLTVTKQKAADSQDLSNTYKFVVEFSNVGGIGLESEHKFVTLTLGVGESETITGIPVGTDYTIYEIKGTDSVLESVINKDDDSVDFVTGTYDSKEAYSVSGTIPATASTTTSYTFSNYKKEVVSFDLKKEWKNSNGTDITENLPDSINVQLQSSTDGSTWTAVTDYAKVEVKHGYTAWADFTYTFKDLDKYENNDTSKPYSYRVVEVNSDGSALTYNKITIDGEDWTVSYANTANQTTITNKAQPKYSLTVNKVDGVDNTTKLAGAEFTLKKDNNDVPITKVSDGNYKYDISGTVTKLTTYGDSGSFTVTGLPEGIYTLTETKAPGGYVNSGNVVYTITFSSSSGATCKIGVQDVGNDFVYNSDTKQATLTVSNIQIVLPSTGGTGSNPTNYVLIGLAIVLVAGIGFVLFNRKAFYSKKN